MKKTLLAILVIVILITSIVFVVNIVDRNEENEEEISIVKQLDTTFIDKENYNIEDIRKIDDQNVLLFTRKIMHNDNGNDSLATSYIVYKYNVENEKNNKVVSFEKNYDCAGINKEERIVYLMLTEYTMEGENVNLIAVNYENGKEVYNISCEEGIQGIKVNEMGNKYAYTKEEGMYISDAKFENEQLILPSYIDKNDITNSKAYRPYKFIDNELVFGRAGYEWCEGIGVMNVNTKDMKFEDGMDMGYLGYSKAKNEIYFSYHYTAFPVYTKNFETREQVIVLNRENVDEGNISGYISDDNKYYLTQENFYEQEENIELTVYSLEEAKKIATHIFEKENLQYNWINGITFLNHRVAFIRNNKDIYLWNY